MSSSPRFQLKPATGIDFPSLIDLLWTSFESPLQGILRLFFPILDNDHPRSLQTCIDGQLEEYRTNQPQLMWVKVVDMQENERIVAGAKWFFYDRDPHGRTHSSEQGENSDKDKHEVANANADEETHLVADWYPEGIAREFATEAARQFERPREVMARGAHAFLHIAYTHPSYRNRGLAHLFLDWGLRIADERGLECWLDASDMGAPLSKGESDPGGEERVDGL
ncbi:hypothetical protein BJY04DRAFT_218990 [Aspergillus karnatakaensis]|uniref:uncharacterized protein n=1 Tax=Aspergillus karnatakaensis TaxID=1810916 RepID=UPI003CCD7EF2